MFDAQGDSLSFPLIAMQFVMRYLTRCTEFCLVCHDRTENVFEALKPYVCSKPLCLYQCELSLMEIDLASVLKSADMSLGFGPSIEHEILTQPYVVDLLISFCYAAAKRYRIREYPTGMSLSVPPLRCVSNPIDPLYPYMPYSAPEPSPTIPPEGTAFEGSKEPCKGKYDPTSQKFVMEEGLSFQIRRGDWVVLSIASMLSFFYGASSLLKLEIQGTVHCIAKPV
jgi:ubiquitin-conjugating enzyme E2 Q